MGIGLRNAWLAAIAVIATGTLGSGGATAVEFKDIAGKWCTTGGSEQFDRTKLIAIPTGTKDRRVYPIERYDFGATQVTVHWRDTKKSETYTTDFGEFSADGRGMVQQPNEKGPRREFHRC